MCTIVCLYVCVLYKTLYSYYCTKCLIFIGLLLKSGDCWYLRVEKDFVLKETCLNGFTFHLWCPKKENKRMTSIYIYIDIIYVGCHFPNGLDRETCFVFLLL